MSLVKPTAASGAGRPPDPEIQAEGGDRSTDPGEPAVHLGTEGIPPSAVGKRVRLADGEVTVVDGPFTESKEHVAACAFFAPDAMDQALHLATRFLRALGAGEIELRPVFDAADRAPRP